MSKGQLETTAKVEQQMVAAVQAKADEVISEARAELRLADDVHKIGDAVLAAQIREQKRHREMTDAWALLNDALAQINSAETIIRSRGETNGR